MKKLAPVALGVAILAGVVALIWYAAKSLGTAIASVPAAAAGAVSSAVDTATSQAGGWVDEIFSAPPDDPVARANAVTGYATAAEDQWDHPLSWTEMWDYWTAGD